MKIYQYVVSIEFSPLSSVVLTISRYQLHNGDHPEYMKKNNQVGSGERREKYLSLNNLSSAILCNDSIAS